jgi:hypothetical protein
MDSKEFQKCFEYLCQSFDLDFGFKAQSMQSYFQSPLGKLTESRLKELINKAKFVLDVKSGCLPSIKALIEIESTLTNNSFDSSDMSLAECELCGDTGFVSIVDTKSKHRYSYAACCTCAEGRKKNEQTTVGREIGLYTNYLSRGFELYEV